MTKKEDEKDIKILTLRIKKDLWNFLRIAAVHDDRNLHGLILHILENYRRNNKKDIDI